MAHLLNRDKRAMFIAQAADKAKATEYANKMWGTRRKSMLPRKHHEDDLQAACVDYLNLYPDIFFFHPVQNLFRGKSANEGAFLGRMDRLKKLGHKAGIPDLIILFKNKNNALTVVFGELKVGSNKLSEAQELVFNKVGPLGVITGVVHSVLELRELLRYSAHPRHQ